MEWDNMGGMGWDMMGEMTRELGSPSSICCAVWPSRQWGRLDGKGLYLFRVVPREDTIPMELLQDILELLSGVWGDKSIALSMV